MVLIFKGNFIEGVNCWYILGLWFVWFDGINDV